MRYKYWYRMCVLPCLIWSVGGQNVLGWTAVGPGIEYQQFQLSDPNNVYVARMDRKNTQCFIESSIGQGRLSGGTETVKNQASRYEDAINFWHQDWGTRNDVIVAINGDFYNTSTGVPTSGQIQSSWLAKIDSKTNQFYWTMKRQPFIGFASVAFQFITYTATGTRQNMSGINRERGTDELIVYTPQYDATTLTDNSGSEVLVELPRPNMSLSSSDPVRGTVRQIRQNLGSTPIPFDHVVLSATGTAATTLLASVSVGDEVWLAQYMDSYWVDLHKVYASVGGGEVFMGNGVVWGGQQIRNPRTAIAYNDDYIFFVVVDGRSTLSVGMTMTELGNFCKDYLDASWGINQDGGGSSTMLVNGVTRNRPSDGSDRSVANGMMMVAIQPKVQSMSFNAGDTIKTNTSTSARLGPGTNYAVASSLSSNRQGTILDHSLRGISAKGSNWWRCDFSGTLGWVPQSALTLVTRGNLATFTQHPASRQVCPGTATTFSVAAGGTGTLFYQWQKNGDDLGEGGHYSGTTGPDLIVSNTDDNDAGSYRCRVTDDHGTVISYSAPLILRPATLIVAQPEFQKVYPLSLNKQANFSVAGTGEGTLYYRWQKDGVDLSDDDHFIGTATATLLVRDVDSAFAGQYRCTVTANCGTVYSKEAELSVVSPDFDHDGDADLNDFAYLQNCLGVTYVQTLNPGCADADLDNTNYVTEYDLFAFMDCMSSEGVPLRPGC